MISNSLLTSNYDYVTEDDAWAQLNELGLFNDSFNLNYYEFNSSDNTHDVRCKLKNKNVTAFQEGNYCEAMSDTIMCWPPTPVNTTAYLKCFSEFLGLKYDDTRKYYFNIKN